jgi:hypothetical protein
MKVVCSGLLLEVYYDGSPIITYYGTTGQESATKVGIGGFVSVAGVRYDLLLARR